MSLDREAVMVALFDKLKAGITGLTTPISRRLRPWEDMQGSEMPAMYVSQGNQIGDNSAGLPLKVIMGAKVRIYTFESDPEKVPSTQINGFINQITNVLDIGRVQGRQRLGTLVENVWLDGNIDTDEGLLFDTSVAILTIKILTTVNT